MVLLLPSPVFCLGDHSRVFRVLGLLIANICHYALHRKVIRSEITWLHSSLVSLRFIVATH